MLPHDFILAQAHFYYVLISNIPKMGKQTPHNNATTLSSRVILELLRKSISRKQNTKLMKTSNLI